MAGHQIGGVITIEAVKDRLVVVRGELSLLDRDVAALYGVETREVNQAVRNNADKFPDGYVLRMSANEFANWKSKILISNLSETAKASVKMGVRHIPYAFTERGLYMLATILKSKAATEATLAIVETFAKVRGLKRELLQLHGEADKKKQTSMMRHFGEVLVDLVMPDLNVAETESSLELNFFIGKLKHTVRRVRKAEN